jgi:DNA repair exonuclease SbcCD ATPase subunit
MSAREDARDWSIANCTICGRPFGQEEAWMDNCPVCFKEQKGYKLLKGDLAFACLQYEIERLRALRANPVDEPADGEVERLQEEIQHLLEECARMSGEVEKAARTKNKMRLRIRDLEGEVEQLRREVSKKKSPVSGGDATIDLPLLRKMLLLCHPDTNPNNVASATEATQWLLAYKQAHHNKQ